MKDKKTVFIEKSNIRHNNKYDYSKVDYVDSLTKVCIICPEHGEFWQTPQAHVRGNGCPICANGNRGKKRMNIDEFIKRAKKVHGNKYDYSKVNYVNAETKVCIICSEHGEFWQRPMAHLNGSGCPKCSGMNKTNDDIINEFRKKHGDKYDYSKVEYIRNDSPVKIICPIHGEFEQKPSKHLIGHGCPKCGIENKIKKQFSNKDEFIEKAKRIHGDRYDYSKVIYKSMRDKVCIICSKHGEFWQYPFDHINEHGCPKCGQLISIAENDIYNFLLTFIDKNKIKRNDRTVLDGREIDIYIPDKRIGIEYNGLKWHSEEYGKDKYYHIGKLEDCNKNGIFLIQVFEDEYLTHRNIVLSKIKHILGLDENMIKIPARKCVVKQISKIDSEIFLNKFHIQGYGKCSISYGCYYQGFLVGVMSFLRIGEKNNHAWELVRFATDYNYLCQGIGGKLFKYFINEQNPFYVKTFADRRWTTSIDNNLYTKLGFICDKIIKPDYKYINPQNPTDRMHKFSFRKRTLHKKYDLPMKMSETQMCNELGFKKIWDCGLIRYVWKKNGE